MIDTVSALYVRTDGPYPALVADWWDADRDARLYAGPNPVVAHPPCKRWGNYWYGSPSSATRYELGDDGEFKAALEAVRQWGGVLEHPRGSRAWHWFGLCHPPKDGGWVWADWYGGWTCCVEQGPYGHPAPKATWLYAAHVKLPTLRWGSSLALGRVENLSKRQRELTPEPFARLLVGMAATAVRRAA